MGDTQQDLKIFVKLKLNIEHHFGDKDVELKKKAKISGLVLSWL